MAYTRRSFAGGAISTTIPNGMGSTDTSFTVAAATGWSFSNPFYVVVDRGLSTEEKMLCSGISGLVVSITIRGADSTSAVAHAAGCTVQVCHVALDDDEANQVVNAVLGQSGAAKGDILAMLSAAGPNTLTRIPITNGAALTAASSLPVWSAAGTAGQALLSNGASAASFQSSIPLLAKDGTLAGVAPAAPGPYSKIAGVQSVVFAGTGVVTFAGGGFPNGCLSVVAMNMSNAGPYFLILLSSTKTAATFDLINSTTGSTVSATVNVSYEATGF